MAIGLMLVKIYQPLSFVSHTNALPYSQDPETTRLLHDDPYHYQYGSQLHNGQRVDQQIDSELLRQERKALDGICHKMSK